MRFCIEISLNVGQRKWCCMGKDLSSGSWVICFAYAKSTHPVCPFLSQLSEDSIASDEKRDELFHTLLDGSTSLTQCLALFELLKVWPQLRSSIGQ